MRIKNSALTHLVSALTLCFGATVAQAQNASPLQVNVNWGKTIIVSRSTPTLQVVTNPMLNPGAPIHDGSFSALKALGADYVRFVPWLPYPKIAVAELGTSDTGQDFVGLHLYRPGDQGLSGRDRWA